MLRLAPCKRCDSVASVRAPADIHAPLFPKDLPWINVAMLRMDQQRGHPVLVEFWDFCSVHSLRTLPYVQAWRERYEAGGLRVISVHAGGFAPSQDVEAVRAAVSRLGIDHAVVVDTDFALWELYGNDGWPSRYLWDPAGELFDAHAGEGAYVETELAIQELLGVSREPLAPLRPEDAPEALLAVPTPDQPGAWSGPYEAGGVSAVLSGEGSVSANGREITVTHPGVYALAEHSHHTEGVLELEVGAAAQCHAVCFTPGLAEPA